MTGAAFGGIWGTAADRIWAVGDQGRIVRWDGSSWIVSASGTTEKLYAGGELGLILRFRGNLP